jgi:hypothetical protein
MTRRSLLVALLAAAVLPASATAAMGGQLASTCAPAGQQVDTLCYGGDVLIRDGQAYAQPNRFEAAIEAYEKSWTHRTLAFQYSLAGDVGFVDAPWLGTHNSFNSIAQQGPALSTTDANQQLKLTDQLRLDMRSLEIDVHWFPSVRAGGQNAPVVCHAGAVSDHDGCSTEPLLGRVLDQIATWLRAHRGQVLLLYIEDHLAGGYPTATAAIKQSLGSLVYGTGSDGNSCKELPPALTRNDVLAAGAQVVLVANSGCGEAGDWRKLAFSWNKTHTESAGPNDFKGFPNCGPYTRTDYNSRLVRFYEDSTWLSAGASAVANEPEGDGLSPAITHQMVLCGVDLFGFDQLEPGDGRLDAAVWSWADAQPGRGSCAQMRSDGRWYSTSCKQKHPAACRAANGSWAVTNGAVKQADAAKACAEAGAAFSVPRTGYENESLKLVTGGTAVWLGVSRTRDGWSASDANLR